MIGLAAEDLVPDPGDWLARLRRDFPHWAFMYDPLASVWVAVRGRARIEVARNPEQLHVLMQSKGERS
ncbi:hypothetical protein [Actinomadura rayongensis]|uniref:Uncharacterized protein n=1 Tax=Actinomadura rayongensis TaxID=1429076 RepID=A0A6I4W652_9ACTN|nr:hypothetical protein [Actinomadura rayongensis]MXQ65018.1 hypothetical protein [Actinomadura rayongensis]